MKCLVDFSLSFLITKLIFYNYLKSLFKESLFLSAGKPAMWAVYIVTGGEVLVLSYFKVRYHSGLALLAGFGPKCDERNAPKSPPSKYLSLLASESESVSHSVLETPWTVACQTPLSMGFSRQNCLSSHSLFQEIFPTQGSYLALTLQADSFSEPPGKPHQPLKFTIWDCLVFLKDM